jgi:hypothetical protein
MPFINLAVAPIVDVRLGVVLAAAGGNNEDEGNGFSFGFGGVADVRFNLGSTYTLMVGVAGGAFFFPSANCTFTNGTNVCVSTGFGTYGWGRASSRRSCSASATIISSKRDTSSASA